MTTRDDKSSLIKENFQDNKLTQCYLYRWVTGKGRERGHGRRSMSSVSQSVGEGVVRRRPSPEHQGSVPLTSRPTVRTPFLQRKRHLLSSREEREHRVEGRNRTTLHSSVKRGYSLFVLSTSLRLGTGLQYPETSREPWWKREKSICHIREYQIRRRGTRKTTCVYFYGLKYVRFHFPHLCNEHIVHERTCTETLLQIINSNGQQF